MVRMLKLLSVIHLCTKILSTDLLHFCRSNCTVIEGAPVKAPAQLQQSYKLLIRMATDVAFVLENPTAHIDAVLAFFLRLFVLLKILSLFIANV